MLRPRPSHMMLSRGLVNFSVTASPPSLSATGSYGTSTTTASTTVSQVTGPVSSLSFAWSLISGSGLTIDSPSSATTTFTGTAPGTSGTNSWTARCTVRNSFGQVAVVDVVVSITGAPPPMTALISGFAPRYQNLPSGQAVNVTATCTPANGTAPYTYSWSYVGSLPGSCSGSGQSAPVTVNGQPSGTNGGATARCLVTDAIGRTVLATASSTINWV